jgi:hypothetical protein
MSILPDLYVSIQAIKKSKTYYEVLLLLLAPQEKGLMAPSTTTIVSFSSQQQNHADIMEGLAWEVTILRLLLQRHRTSHGRTKYYRRMMMTLQCLNCKQPTTTNNNVVVFCDAMERLESCKQETTLQQKWSLTAERSSTNQSTFSSTKVISTTTKTKTTPFLDASLLSQQEEFRDLVRIFTQDIQQVLSRIVHASRALYWEVSRGFFLPFCTVALSALARIRVMVLYLGRVALTQLKNEIQPRLGLVQESMLLLTTLDYEKYMSMFLDDDDDDKDYQNNIVHLPPRNMEVAISPPLDQDCLLASLGLLRRRTRSTLPGTLQHQSKMTTPTQVITSDMSFANNNNNTVAMMPQRMMDVDVGVSVSFHNGSKQQQQPIKTYMASDNLLTAESSTVSTITTKTALSSNNLGVEVNMNFVKSFQRKKYQESTGSRQGSIHTPKQPSSKSNQKADRKQQQQQQAIQKDIIKTKKMKKKGKKGNFFDDLFDS